MPVAGLTLKSLPVNDRSGWQGWFSITLTLSSARALGVGVDGGEHDLLSS